MPLVDYNSRYKGLGFSEKLNYGIHYTPVTLAIYGIGLLQNLKLNKVTQKDAILKSRKIISWLLSNQVTNKLAKGVWLHEFDSPHPFGVSPPYPSAISQALCIIFMISFQKFFHVFDLEINKSIEKAYQSFLIPLKDGGVRIGDDENIWFEEWPCSSESRVLNGSLFSILAIAEYSDYTGEKGAEELLQMAIRSLEKAIKNYDCGFWSRYDILEGLIVSESYHSLHIALLKNINSIKITEEVEKYIDRWTAYKKIPYPIIKLLTILVNCKNSINYRKRIFRRIQKLVCISY